MIPTQPKLEDTIQQLSSRMSGSFSSDMIDVMARLLHADLIKEGPQDIDSVFHQTGRRLENKADTPLILRRSMNLPTERMESYLNSQLPGYVAEVSKKPGKPYLLWKSTWMILKRCRFIRIMW